MNQNKNHTDVLIAGAGPTGLMMACQLAHRNISFRIVDKKESYPQYSGAMLLHSRTMEFLDNLGIAKKILEIASVVDSIKFLFGKDKIIDLEIDKGNELMKFPGIVKLRQADTERILSDFINNKGYEVERGTELLSFTQTDSIVTSKIKIGDKVEFVTSSYLIGADGAHSTVRKQLNISFKGKTMPLSLFVMDCIANFSLDRKRIHFFFNNKITAGFFALDVNKWRVDGCVQKSTGLASNSIDEITKIFFSCNVLKNNRIYPLRFSLIDLHQRIASKMRDNRVFLAGDAAHVHSPAGAQGMNTGIHDSVNLAWKLALVILKKAKTDILISYSEERHEIAKQVVRSTYKPFMLAVSKNTFIRYFRIHFLSYFLSLGKYIIIHSPKLKKLIFDNLSGIRISFSKSILTTNASLGDFHKLAPKPGERWPVQTYSKSKYFTLFSLKNNDILNSLIQKKYSEIIIFQKSFDNDKYNFLDISNDGFYLIRPDNYVAYRSKTVIIKHFQNYLDKILY